MPVISTVSGMSVASLVMGLLWLYWIGSILALVFGYLARNEIDQGQGRLTGRGMATAGIILGWVEIGILIVAIVIGVIVTLQR